MGELAQRRSDVLVIREDADRDTRYRLNKYNDWLIVTGRHWYQPDLAAYRDYLMQDTILLPATIGAHLSTIRGYYVELIRNRELFFWMAARYADDFVTQKQMVDEAIRRIEDAIDPRAAPVKERKIQDRPDSEVVRLTAEQANELMAMPGVGTLPGLRDTAVIATMLCTGIREAELSALEVRDLRQRYDGALALQVREGKGRKQRMVVYGELAWVLAIIDHWRKGAGISRGFVFRGLYKGGRRVREEPLSVRAIEYIVTRYPISIAGELVTVRPHDLRRTYARRLFDAGMDIQAIRLNLGHEDVRTTQGYIGPLDASQRAAPAVYHFDLSRLGDVGKREA